MHRLCASARLATTNDHILRTEIGHILRTEIDQTLRTEIDQFLRTEIGQTLRTEIEQILRTEIGQILRTEIGPILRTEIEPILRTPRAQKLLRETNQKTSLALHKNLSRICQAAQLFSICKTRTPGSLPQGPHDPGIKVQHADATPDRIFENFNYFIKK